jgi:hypothetical protein
MISAAAVGARQLNTPQMCQLISSHPTPQKWIRIEAGSEVFTEVEDAAQNFGRGYSLEDWC